MKLEKISHDSRKDWIVEDVSKFKKTHSTRIREQKEESVVNQLKPEEKLTDVVDEETAEKNSKERRNVIHKRLEPLRKRSAELEKENRVDAHLKQKRTVERLLRIASMRNRVQESNGKYKVKLVNRTDLSDFVTALKESKICYGVNRCLDEGFRYELSFPVRNLKKSPLAIRESKQRFREHLNLVEKEPEETEVENDIETYSDIEIGEQLKAFSILKEHIDVHGEKGKIIIAEKGQLDNEEAPKIEFKVEDKEFDTLSKQFHEDEPDEIEEPEEIEDEPEEIEIINDVKQEVEEPTQLEDGLNTSRKFSEGLSILKEINSYRPSRKAEALWKEIKEKNLIESLNFALDDFYPEGLSNKEFDKLLSEEGDFIKEISGMRLKESEEDLDESNFNLK